LIVFLFNPARDIELNLVGARFPVNQAWYYFLIFLPIEVLH